MHDYLLEEPTGRTCKTSGAPCPTLRMLSNTLHTPAPSGEQNSDPYCHQGGHVIGREQVGLGGVERICSRGVPPPVVEDEIAVLGLHEPVIQPALARPGRSLRCWQRR